MIDVLKKYRDRLRITLILYTFSEPYNEANTDFKKVFYSEIKIQAIDFLLRYPDFLACELINLSKTDKNIDKENIKKVVQSIYRNNEPELRVEEMRRFFYGAYESIDEIILFLKSVAFLEFESKRRIDNQVYDKTYYLREKGIKQIESNLLVIDSVKWYYERCQLIRQYFNHFTGTELKKRQKKYNEYNVPYNDLIQQINDRVKKDFSQVFNESLI